MDTMFFYIVQKISLTRVT